MLKSRTIFSFALLAGTFLTFPSAAKDITEWTEGIDNGYDEIIDNIKVDVEGKYGLISNDGTIGNIESTFTNNENVIGNYGEIGTVRSVFKNNKRNINNYGLIEQVAGSVFENNANEYEGGALASTGGSYIGKIVDSMFTGNTIDSGLQPSKLQSEQDDTGRGGAIYLEQAENRGDMPGYYDAVGGGVDVPGLDVSVTHIVNSTFKGNHAAAGGAIFSSQWLDIEGSVFDGNYNQTRDKDVAGGAIAFHTERIWEVSVDKLPEPEEPVYAGEHNISNSRFENNRSSGVGGAIAGMVNYDVNQTYDINISNSTFSNNSAREGGALYMMSGVSRDNMSALTDKMYSGDAVIVYQDILKYGDQEKVVTYLENRGTQSTVDFDVNNVTAAQFDEYIKAGGKFVVINNTLTAHDDDSYQELLTELEEMESQNKEYILGDLDGYRDSQISVPGITPKLTITNSSFINNKASEKGGAIYGNDIKIIADNGESLFSGNTAGGKSNAVYVEGIIRIQGSAGAGYALVTYDQSGPSYDFSEALENPNPGSLTLESINRGKIIFDDGINGENYNIDVFGDGTGYVKFNNTVENVNRFVMNSGAIVHLGLNGKIYAEQFVSNPSAAYGRAAGNNPLLTVDVMVDKANNTVHSGAIHVSGDVSGETNVLVNALNPDILNKKEDAVVPFLFAPQDDDKTSAVFNVSRVIGSPYMWHADKNIGNTPASGNIWYLSLTDQLNPEYGQTDPEVTPEAIAYIGLPSAGLEQVRGLRDTVEQKTAFCKEGGCIRDIKADHQLWIDSGYLSSSVDKPAEFDADIWGITAGGDLQYDLNNRLGMFAAYRQGEYDFTGEGSRYHANIGSEIDIDSYLAGLYYRYENRGWYAFATLYGGIQKADISTNDGIVKTDSDGTLWSIGAEGGRKYGLSDALTLEPSFGVFYTQSEFDSVHDSAGKTAAFDDLKQLEIESGIKLEYRLCQNNMTSVVYVKPSIIQTITSGDEVLVSGLGKTQAYHDQLLGRIELGARFGISERVSGYALANYTYGSSYDAVAIGLGLNYAF